MERISFFDRPEINTGRQVPFDMYKAFLALMLVPIHIFIDCTPGDGLNYGIPYLFDTIIGGPFGAPLFMFAMGFGMAFSRELNPRKLVKRGFLFLAIGFGLNVFRNLLPYLTGYLITGDKEHYLTMLPYHFFGNDVMQFAGLALFVMALFVALRIRPWKMFAISIVMSQIGQQINGLDTGNEPLNIFLGHFVGTESAAELIMSDFPLMSWMMLVTGGYMFAFVLRRVENQRRFYAILGCLTGSVGISYMLYGIVNLRGMFGYGENCFYHLETLDALESIALLLFGVSMMALLQPLLSEKVHREILSISRGLNAIYCIHWVYVSWIIRVVLYAVTGSQDLSMPVMLLLIFGIEILTLATAHYWRSWKSNRLKGKKI